jgi:phenylpyruvate tautomerase PptA (4-oxalocrotonate tautomerase family)
MPIIDIEVVSAETHPFAPGLAQTLADELSEALGSERGRLWVRLRALPATQYAENQPMSPSPVFVTVLAASPPAGKHLQERIDKVTEVVAIHLERSRDNVHVLIEPDAKGRIAFGGRLVE